MEEQINRFIIKLASFTSSKDYCNFYSYEDSSNELRRNNLRIYLHEIARFKPKVMLIGEAPGYQGTRHTGVPFGSESIILEGVPRLGLFGPGKGYAIRANSERVHKEPTSTIMWATLSEQNFVPLLWAAFPFHPFRLGDELSNRAPTRREVELGKDVYQNLAEIFGITRMVALGNVAHASLAKVGVEIEKIRHPSHGGKSEFGNGIKRIAEGNQS